MIPDLKTYSNFKEDSIQGRYVVNEQIIRFLDKLASSYIVETVGKSVQERPIKSVSLGSGSQKVLMWSQMHGNESTTTKAVLDLLNFLKTEDVLANEILENCTLKIIPILNPDGAEGYTRVNANGVDLNRDAQDRSQPESKVLRAIYEDFKPDFCFNLHDQRTIFNVGTTPKPATVSFLAPSHDVERSISKSRKISMQLIVAMNTELQKMIPGQVGRYDDGFNANCIGDTFQLLNTPTILFEAGHYPDDYQREQTRKYIFCALLRGLQCICKDEIDVYSQKAYFDIPENKKLFYDILVKNAHLIDSRLTGDIGILFSEDLKDDTISFEPKIEKKGNLQENFGHQIFDCSDDKALNFIKKSNFWNILKP